MPKKLTIELMQSIAKKRGGLCLSDKYVNSYTKLKWRCKKGHEWLGKPQHVKNSRSWCPYCAHGRVTDINSLFSINPKLAKEWDYEKNKLKPTDVTATSEYRAWWRCKDNHSWKQSIKSRVKGRKYTGVDCPRCSSFLIEEPNLLVEWNYEKNKELDPNILRGNSNKKVWWKCFKNHEWSAIIANRVKNKSGCPFCNASNSTSRNELRLFAELSVLFPKVEHRKKISGKEVDILIPSISTAIEIDGAYWHRNKMEKDLQKNEVVQSAGFSIFRIREKGLKKLTSADICLNTKDIQLSDIKKLIKNFELKLQIYQKAKNYLFRNDWINEKGFFELLKIYPAPLSGTSAVDKRPGLNREWSEKNEDLQLKNFSYGSHMKCWWRCLQGHEWKAAIKERVLQKQNCPFCSGNKVSKLNSLQVNYSKLLKEWDYEKNEIRPNQISYGSNKKVWWKCSHDHEWQMSIKTRTTNKAGCPKCAMQKAVVPINWFHEYAKKQGGKCLSEKRDPSNYKEKLKYICSEGHEFESRNDRIRKGRWCPRCSRRDGAIKAHITRKIQK